MKDILKRYWGYDDFRGIQEDIINSITSHHDTLGLMPTGGGKSLCFQVPAMAIEGVCIVVTPLISLMRDQVDHLRQRGIIAYAIYTGMPRHDIVRILDNCIFGKVKFLYVSPERLTSQFFLDKLRHIRVSFITIDEAHCISQWGYDFRPSYLNISVLRDMMPDRPVLALTATATPHVVDDICSKLRFRGGGRVFRMSFARQNLTYIVRHTDDKDAQLLHILSRVAGTAIVYTMSRSRTRDIAVMLRSAGIRADYYHAGLDIAVKESRQHDWQVGRLRVIVATNAFGMGIDKPDVRLVVHYDVPSSLEAYFQEAGRAGRDGLGSYAVMLFSSSDAGALRRRVSATFPGKDFVRDVYEHLNWHYEIGVGMGRGIAHHFDPGEFAHSCGYNVRQLHSALLLLHRAGYLCYQPEPEKLARLMITVRHDQLYYITDLSPREDELLQHLMRRYPGLFTTYVHIDESTIADAMHLSRQDVIVTLKTLYRKKILRYLPPRQKPLLLWTVDRVDAHEVELSPEIYDNREAQLKQKIAAVIDYCTNHTTCRSRQLLHYFGEETSSDKDCHTCDVCAGHIQPSQDEQKTIVSDILNITSDGKPHSLDDFKHLPYSLDKIKAAITEMIAEEIVTYSLGRIKVKK